MKDLTNSQKSGFTFSAVIVFYLVLTLIGQAILLAFCERGSVVFLAVGSLFSEIAIFTVSLLHRKKSGETFCNSENCKRFNPLYIVVSVLIAVGMFFGFGKVNELFAGWLIDIGLNVNQAVVPLNNVSQYILFSVLLGVIPAISEELFFRVEFINGLKGMGTLLACLFSGLFFALYHCSASQLIYQFIYGSLLALLTVKSGSAIPSILAHFINNFSVITFNYFKISIPLDNPLIYVLGIVMVLISLAVLLLFPKIKKAKAEKGEVLGLFFPFGIIGVLACVGMIVGGLFL